MAKDARKTGKVGKKKDAAKGAGAAPLAKRPKEAAAPTRAMVVATEEASLGKKQRALLAEALRRAEEARNVVEDALLDFGRWLLVRVFEDDAKAALSDKRDNPVWRQLLARAGGPSLRLGKRFLYVALAIAAHDKRIQDEAWRLLEPGRKELLLPLGDERAMREAAQRVIALKMSHRATRAFVRAQLAEKGHDVVPRVTAPRFQAQLQRFRARVEEPLYREKVARTLRGMPTKERAAMEKELEAVRTWASGLLATVRRA